MEKVKKYFFYNKKVAVAYICERQITLHSYEDNKPIPHTSYHTYYVIYGVDLFKNLTEQIQPVTCKSYDEALNGLKEYLDLSKLSKKVMEWQED